MRPLKKMASILATYNLGAYILHNSDNHLSEYISVGDKRIEKVTGFTGSNAVAVLTPTKSVLYTDSRYFIQAEKELINGFGLMRMGTDSELTDFLEEAADPKIVGIDKRLISQSAFEELKKKLGESKVEVVHVAYDALGEAVYGIPQRVFNEIIDLEKVELAPFLPPHSADAKVAMNNNVTGSTRTEKIRETAEKLEDGQALVITELDTIAWLFNLRGTDILYNPVFYAFAYITKKSAKVFVGAPLVVEGVEVHAYDKFEHFLESSRDRMLVSHMCNAYIADKIPGVQFVDFVVERKSTKNDAEIAGFRQSHVLDGVALTALFEWLQSEVKNGNVKESDVAEKLIEIKKSAQGYRGESFDAICGSGPNSAIVHYKAGCRVLDVNDIMLLDSGSQYLFGTTDVTRTLHFGQPTEEHRQVFTRVLKGNLRVRNLVWRKEMRAYAIEVLSRLDLWKEQQDFGHATSHGVGHFLNVHESPPTSSPNYRLKPGIVMSVEPGLYIKDKFGVRIEDLVLVKKVDESYYEFEPLTCVPLQLTMIDAGLLTADEVAQVNKYSAWVREKLEPRLRGNPGHDWLLQNTRDIS